MIGAGYSGDPFVGPGTDAKGLFSFFIVGDPAQGDYVLLFKNDAQNQGELRFRVP